MKMIEVIIFYIQQIVNFINSLRYIKVLDTNVSLLGLFVTFLIVQVVYSFVYRFFRIERNIAVKDVNRRYFGLRKKVLSRWKK